MIPRRIASFLERLARRIGGEDDATGSSGSSSSSSSDYSDSFTSAALHNNNVATNEGNGADVTPVTTHEVRELESRIAECDEQLTRSEALVHTLDARCQQLMEEVEALLMESFDRAQAGEEEEGRSQGRAQGPDGKGEEEEQCSPDSLALWRAREVIRAQRSRVLAEMLGKRDALFGRVYELRIRLHMLHTQRQRVTEALSARMTVIRWDDADHLPQEHEQLATMSCELLPDIAESRMPLSEYPPRE